MTPEQKIKQLIIIQEHKWLEIECPSINEDTVNDLYDNLEDGDAEYEIREGEVTTEIDCCDSRHYESRSVSAKMTDGSWVGWTYWYGGGKHGEPEAIDWMDEAYDLDCVEEEKVVVVRTFTKKE